MLCKLKFIFTAQTAQAATALDATQQYAAAHPYTGKLINIYIHLFINKLSLTLIRYNIYKIFKFNFLSIFVINISSTDDYMELHIPYIKQMYRSTCF